MVQKHNSNLPPIQQLIQDAWQLFTKTWVAYLKLVGLFISFVFLALLVGILISLPITFVALGSHLQIFNHLTPFTSIMLVLFAVWFVLFLLSLIAIGFITSIVSIFILQGKEKTPIFDLVKQSKKFFWPYFLTTLLGGLAAIGGIMLFVLPGLLIAYFFAFVSFEVVIDEKAKQEALKRSYYMIKTHFWDILGRVLILDVGVSIIMAILHSIVKESASFGLVQFLGILFVGFYARAYIYLLYKEVRAKTTFPQQISIRWIWIVSSIGWVLIIFFATMLAFNASRLQGMMMHHSHQIHRIRNSDAG